MLRRDEHPGQRTERQLDFLFPKMALSDLRVFVFADRAAADGADGSSAAAGSVLARSAAHSAQARVRRVLPLISYSQKWREMRKCAVFVTMALSRAQQAEGRHSLASRVCQSWPPCFQPDRQSTPSLPSHFPIVVTMHSRTRRDIDSDVYVLVFAD